MQTTDTSSVFPRWPVLVSAIGLIVTATIVVYFFSLSNNFIALDDPYVIYNNLALRAINLHTLKEIFSRYDPELYIPLTFFSFQIDYLIGGLHPFQYHLTNLLLHIANALFVAWIGLLLLKNRTTALLCGLLFALHPINVEVVAWATSRKEVLSAFFALSSMICYLYYRSNGKRWPYYLGLLLFALALLSKVNVFVLPLLLLLIDWFLGRRMNRSTLIDKIPFILLSTVFVCVGLFPKLSIFSSTTMVEKVLMAAKSTIFYWQKFLVPIHLSVLYPNANSISLASWDFLVSLVLFVAVVVVVLYSLRRTKYIAFAFGFFLVSIGPTLLHFNRNAAIQSASAGGIQFASDHYMYIPAIGFFLIIAFACSRLLEYTKTREGIGREIVLGIISCVLISLGILSFLQSRVWKDSETLFAHTLKHYPHSIAARVNLSVIYRKSNRFDEERRVLEDGLIYGKNSKLLTGLAAIEKRNKNFDAARNLYAQAMDIDPFNAEPYFGLGVLQTDAGDTAAAYQSYSKALSLDPNYVSVYINLGDLFMREERLLEAERIFLTATEINPSSFEAFYNLGLAYEAQSKLGQEAYAFGQAVSLNPTHVDALVYLASAELKLGNMETGIQVLQRALDIDAEHELARAIVDALEASGVLKNNDS